MQNVCDWQRRVSSSEKHRAHNEEAYVKYHRVISSEFVVLFVLTSLLILCAALNQDKPKHTKKRAILFDFDRNQNPPYNIMIYIHLVLGGEEGGIYEWVFILKYVSGIRDHA